MSFQGTIQAECPKCGDEFETPIWSFVHGGKDEALRDQAKAAECNLLLCPSCGEAFLPEASWIYFEPGAELLAFVLPESWRAEEEKWREKMRADFEQMRGVFGEEASLDLEPIVFFGPDGLSQMLEAEDWRRDERDVMDHFAAELKLGVYAVSPSWARAHRAPSCIPYSGTAPTRQSLIEGMRALVAANDRLTAWSDFLAEYEKDSAAGVPPAAKARA